MGYPFTMKRFIAIVLPLYILDQITKWLVVWNVDLHDSHTVISGFLNLVHVTNTGAAFGMFQNNNWFFIILSSVVLIGIGIMAIKGLLNDNYMQVGMALLVSGILGNLTDRLVHGHVIDFVDVYVGTYHWPSFNVADSAICIAAGLFIWSSFREMKQDSAKKKSGAS